MSFISIALIKPAFERTKKFLLPFNLKIWLKLGFLGLFASGVGLNSNFNYRTSDFSDLAVLSSLWSQYSWLIIGGASFLLLLGVLFIFISNLLTFTLINSVDKEKVLIIKHSKNNLSLGFSYFLFSVVTGFIFLIVITLISLPLTLPLLKGSSIDFSFSSMLLLLILMGFVSLIFMIIYVFVRFFVVYYMYLTKKKFLFSLKKVLSLFKKNYKDMIMFAVMRFVLNIIIGIAVLLLMIFLLIPILIVVALAGGLVYLVYTALGLIVAIIIGGVFGIIIFIILFILLLLLSAPISFFLTIYNLMFMKKILKIKN